MRKVRAEQACGGAPRQDTRKIGPVCSTAIKKYGKLCVDICPTIAAIGVHLPHLSPHPNFLAVWESYGRLSSRCQNQE